MFVPEIWKEQMQNSLKRLRVYANLLNCKCEANDFENEICFGLAVKSLDRVENIGKTLQPASITLNRDVENHLGRLLAENSKNVLSGGETLRIHTPDDAYQHLSKLKLALDANEDSMGGRWVVVPPWYHALLMEDKRFFGNGIDFNRAILQGGLVGEAAGFKVYISLNVPNVIGTTNNVPYMDRTKFEVIAGVADAGQFADELEIGRPQKVKCFCSDALHVDYLYSIEVVHPTALVKMVVTANEQ
jgi:hypothetical protein